MITIIEELSLGMFNVDGEVSEGGMIRLETLIELKFKSFV